MARLYLTTPLSQRLCTPCTISLHCNRSACSQITRIPPPPVQLQLPWIPRSYRGWGSLKTPPRELHAKQLLPGLNGSFPRPDPPPMTHNHPASPEIMAGEHRYIQTISFSPLPSPSPRSLHLGTKTINNALKWWHKPQRLNLTVWKGVTNGVKWPRLGESKWDHLSFLFYVAIIR